MESYIGEIRPFSFNYAPEGWHLCDGTVLRISDYQVLFSLIGNTFGGTYPNTFALPDLRGRCVVGSDQSPQTGTIYNQGETGGAETVTLVSQNLPAHTHSVQAEAVNGTTPQLPGNLLAIPEVRAITGVEADIYADPSSKQVSLNPQTVSIAGGSQPHNNMQPFQVINYCISMTGIYPQRP